MKNKTFGIILALVIITGLGISIGLTVHGYNLWKQISIVEMIANWS
ncbi:MAG: hypothetical protein IKZ29_08785 [Clostridiales bacterium]|nr:hypothetical protein [Clostridiales bacterium]MBR4431489.1 hypothetical protein [Clostridiales bacterium]MBR4948641.1 hypothetical protein [Clostridiales bacterium]